MKFARPLSLASGLFFVSSCAMFETRQTTPPAVVPAKVLTVPLGKNWKLIEEAPKLTDERNRPPFFQTEQSLQPAGASPLPSEEKIQIETPH